MDILDVFRRAGQAVPWGAVANALADAASSRTAAAQEAMLQLRLWGEHFSRNAVAKWPVLLEQPLRCASPDVSTGTPRPCAHVGIVNCDVCGRRVCLEHARLDFLADAICERCIGEAKAQARARAGQKHSEAKAASRKQEMVKAFRVLKMAPTGDFEKVKRQYKAIVFKLSPDRPMTAAERDKNTARLTKVNAAFAVLREHFESPRADGKAA